MLQSAIIVFGLFLNHQVNCISFIVHPENSTVDSLGTVSLTCIVQFEKASPKKYNMKWKKDGDYISTDENVKAVLKDARHFIVTIKKGLIPPGRQALFICKTDANPAVTHYTWTTAPTLNDDTEYNIDDTGQVFMLLKPTINHDGIVITCEAKNQVGSSSNNVTIFIQTEPQNDVTSDNGDKDSKNIGNEKNDEPPLDNNNIEDKSSSGLSIDVIVIIIVGSVVLLVIIVMIPVYYYCLCSRNSSSNQTTTIVHQPEVYFEPGDRMTLPLPHARDVAIWRRSFGAQAPDDKEVDAMYLEIQSNHYIYATKSKCNTIR
ncbi:uncharacterized protein LOC117118409 [Anneissia japonica]|uniref:uncharacterized protein LOC117118409 n=1 Tax=Anneissia japonica TaxID=1529436 RepID=UPI0014259F4C|nr:uncharacterized protein LOC117118409 [Anneissia japonica]